MTPRPAPPPPEPIRSRNYFLIALLASFGMAAAWRWTPLHHYVNLANVAALGHWIESNRWGPLWVLLMYAVAGLLVVSHALMIWATALIFPPAKAFLYAELGTVVSASLVYSLGRLLRRDLIRRIAGSNWEKLSRALGRHGVSTMVILHVFPVAPFSILNLVSGASHIRFRDFLVGSVLGVTPGIIVIAFFGGRVVNLIRHPAPFDFLLLFLFIAAAWFVLRGLRRRLLA